MEHHHATILGAISLEMGGTRCDKLRVFARHDRDSRDLRLHAWASEAHEDANL